jgi:glycosyltransferase 2 family protein
MRGEPSLRGRPARPAGRMPGPVSPAAVSSEPAHESLPSESLGRKIFWLLVRLVIAGALLTYLAKSGYIGTRALSRPITAWPIAIAAIALILIDIALMAQRLVWIFRPVGLRVSFAKSFQVAMVSFFFAIFLPGATGGDLSRLYYVAKDYKARRSEIIIVSLFERGIGMLSLLLMPLIFAPFFARDVAATPALRDLLIVSGALSAILVAGFFFCIHFQPLTEKIAHAVFGILPWKEWYGQVIRTVASYRTSLGVVGAALTISIVGNSLTVVAMVLAVLALDRSAVSLKMSLVIPLGFVANTLPFTPGGLGVGEAAFNSLFAIAGLRLGAEALICYRVWAALVRLLGVFFYLRGIEGVFGPPSGAGPGDPAVAARP